MSLFAFGVIVNTKRLQIIETSHLEGDTSIEDEFTDFFITMVGFFPPGFQIHPPASPNSAVHGEEIRQKSFCAEIKAA